MRIRDYYWSVVKLLDKGEYALAADLADLFLETDPENGWLWQIYGTASYHLQAFDSAVEALETACSMIPLHPLAQYALAACYSRKGKKELASLMYEHLGEITSDARMLASVARCLGALGRNESALEVCRKIVHLNPSYHTAHFGIAVYLKRLGGPLELQIAPLTAAMELAPHIHAYRINLAFTWERLGKNGRAYDLIKEIPLEAVACPCLLKRLCGVFEAAGDVGRSLVCKVRLSCLRQ
jgi:tetratricopeptide (TPR) repeat protein